MVPSSSFSGFSCPERWSWSASARSSGSSVGTASSSASSVASSPSPSSRVPVKSKDIVVAVRRPLSPSSVSRASKSMRILRGWKANRSVPSAASKRPSLSAPLPTSLSIAPVTAPPSPRARTRVKSPVPGAIPSAVAVQRQTPVTASGAASSEVDSSSASSSVSSAAGSGAGSWFRLHRSCQVAPPSSVRQRAPSSVPTHSTSGSKRDSARAVAEPRSVAVRTPEMAREDSPRLIERKARLPAE